MRTVVLLFRLICWPQRGIVGANQHQCGVPMSEEDSSFLCSICFKPIRSEKCKIDKEGRRSTSSAISTRCASSLQTKMPATKSGGGTWEEDLRGLWGGDKFIQLRDARTFQVECRRLGCSFGDPATSGGQKERCDRELGGRKEFVMLSRGEVAIIRAEIERLEKALKECTDGGIRERIKV